MYHLNKYWFRSAKLSLCGQILFYSGYLIILEDLFDGIQPLRLCETPPSPPAPDPVGIENCKQLFSPLLAFTTQKIATRSTGIISAARVAFFWVVNATRNEKSCLQFSIPTAVFHMLLRHLPPHLPRSRSVSKTVNIFFHYGLHLRPKKKQHIQRRWCPYYVLLFFGL